MGTTQEKINQFAKDVSEKSCSPVVFCVKCGSLSVDQNFLYELKCYTCGNTLPWDGTSFSIVRFSDAKLAIIEASNMIRNAESKTVKTDAVKSLQ